MRILNVFKHKVVQGTLWYSVVGLLTSGMSIILLPVMTRWMTPNEFGILNSAISLSQLLLPFVTVGLGAAVVRYYHTYSDEPERFARFFSSAFWFQVAAVIFVSLSVLACYCFFGVEEIAGVDLTHMLPVLLLVILNPPRDLGNQLLTSQEKHGRASVNQLVAFAVGTALSLWLIGKLDLGASGRLYGRAAGAGAAALMLFRLPEMCSRVRLSVDIEELKTALKFGVPYIPYAFAMAGMLSADKLILQHYVDLESVGVYSAAKTVAMGMSFVFVAVTRAWYPRYFALRKEGKEEELMKSQWAVLCILVATVLGFVILAPLVYPLIVDARYISGARLLPLLGMGIYLYGLFLTQSNYITYLKKTVYLPVIAGAGALTSVLLAVYLIPKSAMQGAAIATLGGYLVMNLTLFGVSLKLEKRLLERVILPCVSIATATIGAYCCYLIPESSGWLLRGLMAFFAWFVVFGLWRMGQNSLNPKALDL